MKYQILRNYYSAGYSFEDEKFETIDEAVKYALSQRYGAPFLIVEVIDWEAKDSRGNKVIINAK